MSRKILAVVIGLIVISQAVSAQGRFRAGSEPNNFRGVEWGTGINRFNSMKQIDIWDDSKGIPRPPADPYASQHSRNYIKTNDSLEIEGVKVKKIIYHFWKDRFLSASASIKNREDYQRIKDKLFKKYGEVKPEAIGFTGVYMWQGNVTRIILSAYIDYMGEAVLEFASVEEHEKYIADMRSNR